jgi:hypothetical protein
MEILTKKRDFLTLKNRADFQAPEMGLKIGEAWPTDNFLTFTRAREGINYQAKPYYIINYTIYYPL